MMRWNVIQYLIDNNKYKSYLELGLYKSWNFDKIKCEEKDAVDPNPSKTLEEEKLEYGSLLSYSEGIRIWKQTTDDFFRDTPPDKKWDLIFIDALHESIQVDRDIQNALKHLSPGGTIVMHDCLPTSLEMITTGTKFGEWTGDTYKSFINFTTAGRCDFAVVDTDYGVGIIQNYTGLQQSMKLDYSFEDFQKNKKELMNIISVEEFLKRETKEHGNI